jgi:hypothetical protein
MIYFDAENQMKLGINFYPWSQRKDHIGFKILFRFRNRYHVLMLRYAKYKERYGRPNKLYHTWETYPVK